MDELIALLSKAWGNSTMLQRSGGLVSAALSQPDPEAALRAAAAAPLRNFAKDLDFVLQVCRIPTAGPHALAHAPTHMLPSHTAGAHALACHSPNS